MHELDPNVVTDPMGRGHSRETICQLVIHELLHDIVEAERSVPCSQDPGPVLN